MKLPTLLFSFLLFFTFPLLCQSCNALSLASLCCGRCYTSSWNLLGLIFFHPTLLHLLHGGFFSFFSFFVVCLVGGGGWCDVGGHMKLSVVCAGRCSASLLVDFIQDGSRFGFCRTTWGRKAWIPLSPHRYALHFIFISLPNPNTARPPTTLPTTE